MWWNVHHRSKYWRLSQNDVTLCFDARADCKYWMSYNVCIASITPWQPTMRVVEFITSTSASWASRDIWQHLRIPSRHIFTSEAGICATLCEQPEKLGVASSFMSRITARRDLTAWHLIGSSICKVCSSDCELRPVYRVQLWPLTKSFMNWAGIELTICNFADVCSTTVPRPPGSLKWNLYAFKVGVTIMYTQYAQINELQTNYFKIISATTEIKFGQIMP